MVDLVAAALLLLLLLILFVISATPLKKNQLHTRASGKSPTTLNVEERE